MKAILRSIIAIGMAFLLLFSTLSFSVGMHFCGDHLVAVSLSDKALGCGMEMPGDEPSGSCALAAMNCCTDVQLFRQGQDDLHSTAPAFTAGVLQYLPIQPWTPTALFEVEQLAYISFKEYPPPFIKRDRNILHQSFLI